MAAAAWSAFVFFVSLSAAAVGWVYWSGSDDAGPTPAATRIGGEEEPATDPDVLDLAERRAIDGVPAEKEATRLYAVVIDNMSVARPQAGLHAASLVIEAPVEGGITRLLAVFPEEAALERIGPVRSARPYFLDWASEIDALFVHVGGSPEALERLQEGKPRSINEFSWGGHFWRDKARSAPHNVYTSIEDLKKAESRRYADHEAGAIEGWRFKADAAPEERPETGGSVAVAYPDAKYAVRWTYDRERNDYVREQGGRPQADDDASLVRAKNVVVQYTQVSVIDEVGRKRIATVGEGDALIAVDGLAVHGTWKKESVGARTIFLDASGNPIRFNVGTTWIEVVPKDTDVDY